MTWRVFAASVAVGWSTQAGFAVTFDEGSGPESASRQVRLGGSLALPGEEWVPESALRQVGLTPYWQAELPLQRGDSAVSAVLLEDRLYVVTRLGDLHAVDATVGLVRWSQNVTDRGRRVFKPFHLVTPEGRPAVLVVHSEGAFIFDGASGEVLAEMYEMWPAGSAAVGDAFSLYVGGSDGSIHAVRWYDPVHRTPVRTWRVLGDGPVTATPLLINGVLIFASQSGAVYACTADWNKDLHWRHRAEAAVVADLYGDESGVYVASLDRSLYRLDLASGAVLWRYRFPHPLRDAPIVSQRVVYQFCPQSGLYAIDVDTRQLLWTQPTAVAFVSRRAERTCVLFEDDRLGVLESNSGKVLGSIPLPARCLTAGNPDSLTCYVVTSDGRVGCFASREVRHLTTDDLLRGLTPAGESEGAEAGPPRRDSAKEVRGGVDVDLDDPLRSGGDR